jgi:hypothetical protein
LNIVFPQAEYFPSITLESASDAFIAKFVTCYFGFPERGVVLGPNKMFWAGVPETAVNKYHNPCFGEDNIGLSREFC